MRSSPKESVTKLAAQRRRRDASLGEEGWWFVVRGIARPSETRERRMRVSPQWAVTRVEGVEGCQNGVGVGVEIRAIEAVEPPLKGALFWGFWCCKGRFEGEWRLSFALRGRSSATVSEEWVERRSWARRKVRSVWRKAWVRIVLIVGGSSGGSVKAVGRKRRKYPPTVWRQDFMRVVWREEAFWGLGNVVSFCGLAVSGSSVDDEDDDELFVFAVVAALFAAVLKVDCSPYLCAVSSIFSCSFSLK